MDLRGYKTVFFSGLFLAIALANIFGFSQFAPSDDVTTIAASLSVLVPVVNIILRVATKTPIFKSE